MSSDSRSIIPHSLIVWWIAYGSLVPPPVPRPSMLFESAGADSLNLDHSKSTCVIPFPFAKHSFPQLPLQSRVAMWPGSGQSNAGSILRDFTCFWEARPSRRPPSHFSLLWVLNIGVPLACSFVFYGFSYGWKTGVWKYYMAKKSRNEHVTSFQL